MVRQTCRNCMFLKLSVVLFFFGCAQLNSESTEVERILEGKISDESSGKPLIVDVFLYKLRKPLFSMRGWERIAMTKTDEHGFFSFKINETGPYEVRWNPEGRVVSHEFSVAEFDGRKYIEIFHQNREKEVYPWD